MFGLPVANEAFVSLTILSGVVAIVALGNSMPPSLFGLKGEAGLKVYQPSHTSNFLKATPEYPPLEKTF